MKTRTGIAFLFLAATLIMGACQPKATPVTPTVALPPTTIPSPTPTAAPPSSQILPMGVLVGAGNVLKIYDPGGGFLFEMSLPISAKLSADTVHLAGPYRMAANMPVIFRATKPLDALYQMKTNGDVDRLGNISGVQWLVGAPGLPAYAFGRPGGEVFFVGTLDGAPTAILPDLAPAPRGVRPLAIDVQDSQPAGVWFTMLPNSKETFLVEPRRGLYFTDLADRTTISLLPEGLSPCALSDDRAWVAYTDPAASQTVLLHLATQTTVKVTWLVPGQATVAGKAAFSPGNTYLAWVESNGSATPDTPNFQSTIRISTLDGSLNAEIPASEFAVPAAFSAVNWAWPVGWLDDHRLVVQARETGTENMAVLVMDVLSGRKMLLAGGNFVGFLYQ